MIVRAFPNITDALLAVGMLTWTRVVLSKAVGALADEELGDGMCDEEGCSLDGRGPGYGNKRYG